MEGRRKRDWQLGPVFCLLIVSILNTAQVWLNKRVFFILGKLQTGNWFCINIPSIRKEIYYLCMLFCLYCYFQYNIFNFNSQGFHFLLSYLAFSQIFESHYHWNEAINHIAAVFTLNNVILRGIRQGNKKKWRSLLLQCYIINKKSVWYISWKKNFPI